MIRSDIPPVHADARSGHVRLVAPLGFRKKKWRRRKVFLRPVHLCYGCFPAICSRGYRLRSNSRLMNHIHWLRCLLRNLPYRNFQKSRHLPYLPFLLPEPDFPEVPHVYGLPVLQRAIPIASLPESAGATVSVPVAALEFVLVWNLVPYLFFSFTRRKDNANETE